MTFCERNRQTQGSASISAMLIRFSKFFYSMRAMREIASGERVFQMGLANASGYLRILPIMTSCSLPRKGAFPDSRT
jgi:hypothetical protein